MVDSEISVKRNNHSIVSNNILPDIIIMIVHHSYITKLILS